MKTAPNTQIYDRWANGGPFIGPAGAPHGRVTVEIGWVLRSSSASTYDKAPLRWFQRTNNSQTETEIPNINTIDINRTIDTDSATLKLVMTNQKMAPNGTIITGTAGESVGQPGYYYPTRGDSAESIARWGWSTNEWNDVLQPNALIRTYQGYGGRSKSINQALADGNIVQTGTWLVDDTSMDAASGNLSINCRDMAKLLIEQTIYPPLVPTSGAVHYPINYYRWVHVSHPVIPYGKTIYRTGYQPIENDAATISASSSNAGHEPPNAVDGSDPDTYWLSAGHLTSEGSVDFEYLEVNVGDSIDGFYVQPYAGNYTVYVSVMVGGTWQGANTIPTTIGAENIKYVRKLGLGWEKGGVVQLDQTYAAQKLRLTFTHLAKTSVGPAFYRAGVRDFNYGKYTGTVTGGGRTIKGVARASTKNGYWMVGSDGGVFSFGKAKFYGSEGSYPTNAPMTGMAGGVGADEGKGYRLCGADGGVFCFGNLPYKGSLPGLHIATIRVVGIENSGHDGYYLVDNQGHIFAFGGAPYYGNLTSGSATVGMAVNPGGGYWIADGFGNVGNFGPAANHGHRGAGPTPITAIEATSTGNGYWCVSEDGAVYAFGDAVYRGGVNNITLNEIITDIVRTSDDGGYWLVAADGGVFIPTNGNPNNAQFAGSLPQQYDRVQDGNYNDYADIVKDFLIWCGWWFFNPALGDATPPDIYGNIESTGIYAPDNLTEDFFDKKPVIDVINTLKEITGYINYADETGAYNYRAPNIFTIGNFLETGAPTATIPSIDEALQITQYSVAISDSDARSEIIIATSDPQLHFTDTKSVTITSQWGPDLLRGIIRPALWVNGQFLTTEIQTTMANLIDLHLFMAQRQGSLTMPANPILQIDDQVRIFERATSETYIHYVRGYTSSMNMQSGEYTMTLQTHWLGDGSGSGWALTYT